jgi:hypothetical protein
VPSQVLAQHVALTSNDFTLAALFRPAPPLVVLNLTADTGIATGNHGDSLISLPGGQQSITIEETTRLFTEVANLELGFS